MGKESGKVAPILVFLLALAPAFRAHATELCLDEAPVCIEQVDRGGSASLVVRNDSAAPYSVRVQLLEFENLKPQKPAPFRAVVRPGERKVVGSLAPIAPGEPTRLRYEWKTAIGSLLARHDDRFRYRMPYGGTEPSILSKGVGGEVTHRGPATYAFDFSMPWGTPVLAARGGIVIDVVDGAIAGGLRKVHYDRANKVDVLHADGTIATYAHLKQDAEVAIGQRVAAGQKIGRSGDTGLLGGPHLHFMVWRRKTDLTFATLPIRFHDGTARGFVPVREVAYAPACQRGDRECTPDAGAQENVPAAVAEAPQRAAARRSDGACACPNGAVIHIDLPCDLVCGN